MGSRRNDLTKMMQYNLMDYHEASMERVQYNLMDQQYNFFLYIYYNMYVMICIYMCNAECFEAFMESMRNDITKKMCHYAE